MIAEEEYTRKTYKVKILHDDTLKKLKEARKTNNDRFI